MLIDHQYKELVRAILEYGIERSVKTDSGRMETKTLPHVSITHDLGHSFPLVSLKKTNMKNLFIPFLCKYFLSFFLLLSISLPAGATEGFNLLDGLGGEDDILEPDDAFQISYDSQPGQFKVNWLIADGHYLYRDKMQITTH